MHNTVYRQTYIKPCARNAKVKYVVTAQMHCIFNTSTTVTTSKQFQCKNHLAIYQITIKTHKYSNQLLFADTLNHIKTYAQYIINTHQTQNPITPTTNHKPKCKTYSQHSHISNRYSTQYQHIINKLSSNKSRLHPAPSINSNQFHQNLSLLKTTTIIKILYNKPYTATHPSKNTTTRPSNQRSKLPTIRTYTYTKLTTHYSIQFNLNYNTQNIGTHIVVHIQHKVNIKIVNKHVTNTIHSTRKHTKQTHATQTSKVTAIRNKHTINQSSNYQQQLNKQILPLPIAYKQTIIYNFINRNYNDSTPIILQTHKRIETNINYQFKTHNSSHTNSYLSLCTNSVANKPIHPETNPCRPKPVSKRPNLLTKAPTNIPTHQLTINASSTHQPRKHLFTTSTIKSVFTLRVYKINSSPVKSQHIQKQHLNPNNIQNYSGAFNQAFSKITITTQQDLQCILQ
eukprot:gene13002-8848_t